MAPSALAVPSARSGAFTRSNAAATAAALQLNQLSRYTTPAHSNPRSQTQSDPDSSNEGTYDKADPKKAKR